MAVREQQSIVLKPPKGFVNPGAGYLDRRTPGNQIHYDRALRVLTIAERWATFARQARFKSEARKEQEVIHACAVVYDAISAAEAVQKQYRTSDPRNDNVTRTFEASMLLRGRGAELTTGRPELHNLAALLQREDGIFAAFRGRRFVGPLNDSGGADFARLVFKPPAKTTMKVAALWDAKTAFADYSQFAKFVDKQRAQLQAELGTETREVLVELVEQLAQETNFFTSRDRAFSATDIGEDPTAAPQIDHRYKGPRSIGEIELMLLNSVDDMAAEASATYLRSLADSVGSKLERQARRDIRFASRSLGPSEERFSVVAALQTRALLRSNVFDTVPRPSDHVAPPEIVEEWNNAGDRLIDHFKSQGCTAETVTWKLPPLRPTNPGLDTGL